MAELVVLNDALTEKGGLKTAVAAQIKAQGRKVFEDLGFKLMPNGRMAKEVATAEGKLVTLNVDLTVGLDTNFEKKVKGAKTVEATPVEVPDLFQQPRDRNASFSSLTR